MCHMENFQGFVSLEASAKTRPDRRRLGGRRGWAAGVGAAGGSPGGGNGAQVLSLTPSHRWGRISGLRPLCTGAMWGVSPPQARGRVAGAGNGGRAGDHGPSVLRAQKKRGRPAAVQASRPWRAECGGSVRLPLRKPRTCAPCPAAVKPPRLLARDVLAIRSHTHVELWSVSHRGGRPPDTPSLSPQ